MLVAGFALLILASAVGFWRAVARNQKVVRYLQEPGETADQALSPAQLGPEKWAVVAPIRTLELVVRGEMGALNVGNSNALAASTVVNTEIARWLADREHLQASVEEAEILDALSLQIQALWEQGRWGISGSLDKATLLVRLEALERSLKNAASQVAAGHSPYR